MIGHPLTLVRALFELVTLCLRGLDAHYPVKKEVRTARVTCTCLNLVPVFHNPKTGTEVVSLYNKSVTDKPHKNFLRISHSIHLPFSASYFHLGASGRRDTISQRSNQAHTPCQNKPKS